MIPLTILYDEYIGRPKLTEQKKNPVDYIVPPPTSGIGTNISQNVWVYSKLPIFQLFCCSPWIHLAKFLLVRDHFRWSGQISDPILPINFFFDKKVSIVHTQSILKLRWLIGCFNYVKLKCIVFLSSWHHISQNWIYIPHFGSIEVQNLQDILCVPDVGDSYFITG